MIINTPPHLDLIDCKSISKNSDRIEFIDLAKGLCIFMVVIWHIVPDFFDKLLFLSCLRMPLYFCLSGLFYKQYGKFHQFIIKKSDKILIPFIAWYIISYGIHYIKQITLGTVDPHYIDEIFYTHDTINAPLWFLLCLFWCNIYFTIIDRAFKSIIGKSACVLILALIGIALAKFEMFNFLFFASAMTCLPFFFFGYLLRKTAILLESYPKRKSLFLLLFFGIIIFILTCFPATSASMSYHENYIYGNPIFLYILGCGWTLFALLGCKFIGKIPYISFIGRFSIIVLVTHMLISGVINPLILKLMPDASPLFNSVVLLLLVLILLPLSIMCCRTFLPYITAQKDPIQTLIQSFNRRKEVFG